MNASCFCSAKANGKREPVTPSSIKFTAENAEDFAKARRGVATHEKSFIIVSARRRRAGMLCVKMSLTSIAGVQLIPIQHSGSLAGHSRRSARSPGTTINGAPGGADHRSQRWRALEHYSYHRARSRQHDCLY